MSRKHSLAPWRVDRMHGHGTYVRAQHGGLVASMLAGSQPMRDADARLIAAAPDLLEALEWIASSYPETDEGAMLAEHARGALARVQP